MSLAALLNLGGGEVILILALILILLGAKRLRQEMTGQKADDARPSHPVLMALTLILGAACLILVAYEFSK